MIVDSKKSVDDTKKRTQLGTKNHGDHFASHAQGLIRNQTFINAILAFY